MIILGLNCYHPDSAACVLRDGYLVAAAEEERFTRIKHWAGFPINSIRYCLREANVKPSEINHIAVNTNPWAQLLSKLPVLLKIGGWHERITRLRARQSQIQSLQKHLDSPIYAKLHHVEHHLAHCASAFLCSPYPSATVVSVDGSGDFSTIAWAEGSGDKVRITQRQAFPHSLGLFYLALTQYLGFDTYGDEYKVMGLAAYGSHKHVEELRELIRMEDYGRISLNLQYFQHHLRDFSMTWTGGSPVIGQVYSDRLKDLLSAGPRDPDLAASLQVVYEESLDYVLRHEDHHTLCLAGGCALNSVANGKLLPRYQHLYIPPVPHDAGGALGAALHVWCQVLGNRRRFVLDRADWGPSYDPPAIDAALGRHRDALQGCLKSITQYDGQHYRELLWQTCKHLSQGRIVGWFQGRMEFGQRALGYRSILADPRSLTMRTSLNARIKHREGFRPFAPSVLEEKASDWFELSQASPFMSYTVPVKMSQRPLIPAVTHVDGSARPQTVSRKTNPLFWELLDMWNTLTGVPVLLNTSFNENEPIVCSPDDALDCFLRTEMDALVMGPWMLVKK